MAITERELNQAETRMAQVREAGYALSARYDQRRSRIVVALSTGVELAFPTRLAEGLANASPEHLADIEISPAGLGLHWPRLDADLYVPSLLFVTALAFTSPPYGVPAYYACFTSAFILVVSVTPCP